MYSAPKSEMAAQSCLEKPLCSYSIITLLQLIKERSVGNWLESEARCRWQGIYDQGPPGAGHPGQPPQRCHFRFLSVRTEIFNQSEVGENCGWSWAVAKLRRYAMDPEAKLLIKVLGKISGKAVVKPRFCPFCALYLFKQHKLWFIEKVENLSP